MGKPENLVGKKFGRWLVIGRDNTKHLWLCRCECGTERYISTGKLNAGATKSCGCSFRTRHGLSHHPLAARYNLMLARCYDCNSAAYKNYGGRGIYVCERWLGNEGLVNYINDVSKLPHAKDAGVDLDRINNDGPYSPTNVHWVTRAKNLRNYRRNLYVTVNGEKLVAIDAAKNLHIPERTFYNWIKQCGPDIAVQKAKHRLCQTSL